MILEASAGRLYKAHKVMMLKRLFERPKFTCLVHALQAELHEFHYARLRCNPLEWTGHSASLRLALHPRIRTLQPVQPRFPG
ncbi:hypothetical protein [Pseudomonas sp. N040]|uniref:hypothetical protein n=1 Tax=Pseudomonas sp. N040 TaxID=2785325 RepID=UPI0018A283BB|nr:hypothetical protein [Pseudomonas sp. N040]MBF7728692.1 hypothetical protein [Pseudomonas sp. N040]MBW7012332.1 hypothetical protein [Pseudomonas sp. N040]